MRIFLYEYLSTGAMADQPGAASLAREGWAMLSAVTADLSDCPGVQVVTMPRLDPGDDEESLFRRLVRQADAALLIAPEFDDLLARRAEWVLEEDRRLLGPSPDAIRLTGDKLRFAERLRWHAIPTPDTVLYQRGQSPFAFPIIVKPRFGAGCQATFRIDHQADFDNLACPIDTIVQPEWRGSNVVAASVALLVGPSEMVPLLPGLQQVSCFDGAYHYRGGRLPLDERLRPPAIDLARRAVAVVPGLRGYVGVDLVLAPSGAGAVIEINPRLTTSYVGLRRLARFNVGQAMLDVIAGRQPAPLEYLPGEIVFLPDGSFLQP